MVTHDSKLRGREQVAHGTMAFHFDKPAGFKFKPGQAIDVVLLEPPAGDAQSARHTFSIVSAPFENQLVLYSNRRPEDAAYLAELRSSNGMVEAMRQTLNDAGVNDDDIRSEEFYGY